MTLESGQTTIGDAAAAIVDRLRQNMPKAEELPPVPVASEPFKPGVYFDLDEDAYHADTALGSTDIRKLYYSPCDYWFSSPFNIHKPEEERTPAQEIGRAVHKFVLEGRAALDAEYAPAFHPGNIKAGKAEREMIRESGRNPIAKKDYDRICLSGTMIRANEYLAEAFSGGRSEVSVFWEAEGLRKKARFDYLKQRAIVDLKSIRNSRKISFVEACRRSMAEWDYPTQAQHYRDGRMAMRSLVSAGAVFGDHDAAWLKKVVEANEWAFVFCFWQADNAPLTWATQISPGNGILDVSRRVIDIAERNYREFMERFGPSTPWVIAEPLNELDINELPAWWHRAA